MMTIYEKVERIFGYRQLTLHMRSQTKKTINHKRVYRLMKVKGIQSVIRRKKKKYGYSTPQQVAENLLNRKFQATAPNEKWVTDVTEFKYGHGQKAYLSAILDLHDKSIVSYVMGYSNNNPLVFQTLKLALQAAPGSKPMLTGDFNTPHWTSKSSWTKTNCLRVCLELGGALITVQWNLSGEP
jgi:putative transposase